MLRTHCRSIEKPNSLKSGRSIASGFLQVIKSKAGTGSRSRRGTRTVAGVLKLGTTFRVTLITCAREIAI